MVKIARMVLFLVVSCFVLQNPAFAVGGSDIGDKIVKLQNELGKLKTEHTRQALLISELEQQLSVVRNNAMIDVQNVITSSTEKDSQADEVKGHISALKGDVDKLQQAVEDLKGEISDLKSKQEKAIKDKKDKQEEERATLIKPTGSLLDDQSEPNDGEESSKNPQTVKREASDKLSSDHSDVAEDKATEKVIKSKSKKKLTEEKATEEKNKEAKPAKKPASTSEKTRKTTKPEVSEDESDTRDETELANDAIAEAEKLEAEDSSESSDSDSGETSEKAEDQASDDGESADDESESAQADDEGSETEEAE